MYIDGKKVRVGSLLSSVDKETGKQHPYLLPVSEIKGNKVRLGVNTEFEGLQSDWKVFI
jgi:hypothetical protein